MKRLVMKICTRCKIEQNPSEFHKNNSRPDKLHYWCKSCVREKRREREGSIPQQRFVAPEGTRRCSYCEKYQPIDLFPPSTLNGKYYVCIPCKPQYSQNVWYKHKYGITLTEFTQLLESQNFECAACGDTLDEQPHLDHCHKTEQIRGILCANCNRALGMLKDDPERILALHRYLIETGDFN